jgi:hypothetical protein
MYDRKVGISAPPAGSVPNGKPSPVPRSHAFHERAQSSRLIQIERRIGVISSGGRGDGLPQQHDFSSLRWFAAGPLPAPTAMSMILLQIGGPIQPQYRAAEIKAGHGADGAS